MPESKKRRRKRGWRYLVLVLVVVVVLFLAKSGLDTTRTVPPPIRYPHACAETSLYDHAIGRGVTFNLERTHIVQVINSISGFEDMYNEWYNLIWPKQVYAGSLEVLDGAKVRLPNGTMARAGTYLYGLYFLVDFYQPVNNTRVGPMVIIYQCMYD